MIFVTPARFERATYGLGNRCSIHLSYGAFKEDAYLRRCLLGVNRSRAQVAPDVPSMLLSMRIEIDQIGVGPDVSTSVDGLQPLFDFLNARDSGADNHTAQVYCIVAH